MKRGKKLSALFLALVMAFSLAIPAGAANWDDDLTGHIVILHTNDVHGAIDNYASVAALKDAYEAAGAQVLLMDAGDFSQGSTSVNVSEGATAVELMNMAGYDVATTGNHEFDFGYANLKTLMEQAEFPILAANAFTAGRAGHGRGQPHLPAGGRDRGRLWSGHPRNCHQGPPR